MPQLPLSRAIRFGVFELEPRTGILRKRDARVRLQEQPFQVLLAVLEKPGEIVTREELHQRVWPGQEFGDLDHRLNIAVNKIREALRDSAETPHFLETLPKRGYRFIAPVEGVPRHDPQTATAGRSYWRLAWIAAGLLVVIWWWSNRGHSVPLFESLAVIPFQNLSGDPNQDYVSDGLTEALIGEVARIGTLRVISRTSVMRYKGERKPLPQIARELNVGAVIEGSVAIFGGRAHVSVQLLDGANDRHLWSETYDRDLAEIPKLWGEVAAAIAREIRAHIQPEVRPRQVLKAHR